MSGLGDMAPGDETALWQSLSGVHARFSAGGKYANPTRGETRVMILGGCVCADVDARQHRGGGTSPDLRGGMTPEMAAEALATTKRAG